MTTRETLNDLVAISTRRALSADERSQLRALLPGLGGEEADVEVSSLELLAATAKGQAQLSDDERTRVLEGALRRHRKEAPSSRRHPSRVAVARVFAIAAGVVLIAGAAWLLRVEPAEPRDREKAGASSLSVSLVRQAPGQPVGEAVKSPVTLTGAETVRVVAQLAEPGHTGLYESASDGLHLVWQSSGVVPAGATALGPDDGRAGLIPERSGRTRYWVVVSDQVLSPALADVGSCLRCVGAPFDVDRD